MAEAPAVCPLCGDSKARQILTTRSADLERDFTIVECVACGLRFTDPVPNDLDLARLYAQDYYVQNSRRLLSRDLPRMLFQLSVFAQRRSALMDTHSGRILDVGCGNGDFLASLKRKGWEVCGTEFSDAACEIARSKGVSVQQGNLIACGHHDGYFDAITYWHVLEHLKDPLAQLTEARRLLRDDGLLVVQVPNSDSPTFRICRGQWEPLDAPRHLQHFSKRTLTEMLERCGFVSVRTQRLHHYDFTFGFYSFANLLGIRERLGISYFSTDYKRAANSSRLAFAFIGLLAAIPCIIYSVIATTLTGNGETVTITARKRL